MKFSGLVLVVFFMTADVGVRKVFSQDYISIFSQDYTSRLSLEIDPVSFVYKGYSLHFRYQPMFSQRFLIGAGTYAMDLPEMFVNMNGENRDEGWRVRIKSAYLMYGELYFKEANHGWFFGQQLGFQAFKVSNNREVSGSARFNNIVVMASLGYSWHPYKGPFFIKPWAGIGFTDKVDGVNRIKGLKYDIASLFPFFTFHAGYNF
jgi:hypothetical protein